MAASAGLIELRGVLAAGSVWAATAICLVQGHVRIVLSDPRTYASPLHHRCGLLLVGCIAWAGCEWVRGMTRTEGHPG